MAKYSFLQIPPFKKYVSLKKDWKDNLPIFFLREKDPGLEKQNEELKNNFNDINNGVYTFFNAFKISLGTDYDWVTNPLTNYKYDINKHWSKVEDFS